MVSMFWAGVVSIAYATGRSFHNNGLIRKIADSAPDAMVRISWYQKVMVLKLIPAQQVMVKCQKIQSMPTILLNTKRVQIPFMTLDVQVHTKWDYDIRHALEITGLSTKVVLDTSSVHIVDISATATAQDILTATFAKDSPIYLMGTQRGDSFRVSKISSDANTLMSNFGQTRTMFGLGVGMASAGLIFG